jgi:REP element-mobilizing transposase RayT
MSNHIHFLIEIKDKIIIPNGSKYSESQFVSKQLSNLFSSYSQAFNKQQKRMGNLFISNFRRQKVSTDEYLSNLIKYIHLNPVRHKAVKNISQWKFSSYNILCSEEGTFLARQKTIGWFGGVEEFRKFHEG